MRKLLIAFDGSHFSEGAIEFARQLNRREPVLLTGAFLPLTDVSHLWSYAGGSHTGDDFIPLIEDEEAEAVKANITRFESYCRSVGIEYRVHKDYFDFALPELKKESRFADLLIISSQTFYEQAGKGEPNDYLKQALHSVECPVVVVSEKFDFPLKNILTYDGTESSVFAIKQFAYTLPELAGNDTVLVHLKDSGEEQLPEETNISELVARHFNHPELFSYEADPKKHFVSWLKGKKDAIVVSGSFGRSGMARLFHKSFIAEVLAEHRLPVFIAHR